MENFTNYLSNLEVTNNEDEVVKLIKVLENDFKILYQKTNEYQRTGKLVVEFKFKPNKDTKDIELVVKTKKTEPKCTPINIVKF